MSTAKKLESITDNGLFETLSLDCIRISDKNTLL